MKDLKKMSKNLSQAKVYEGNKWNQAFYKEKAKFLTNEIRSLIQNTPEVL
jgi:hypothetical protein